MSSGNVTSWNVVSVSERTGESEKGLFFYIIILLW